MKHLKLKKYVKVTQYNTGNVAARLKQSKSINVLFYTFDFGQDLTCANDSYTHIQTYPYKHTHAYAHAHRHTNTHTELHDMPMAIGKSTDLRKK